MEGKWGIRIWCGEREKRVSEGQENEWKSATGEGGEVVPLFVLVTYRA